jgi:hypothetical protein
MREVTMKLVQKLRSFASRVYGVPGPLSLALALGIVWGGLS